MPFLSSYTKVISMKPCLHFSSTIVILISINVLSACSSGTKKTDQTSDSSELFEPCGDSSGLDCGRFEVPIIHNSTDNRKINIEVARLPGTGQGHHEPLLINLGGPGSGIEVLRELAESGVIPGTIRKRYDIIGFDRCGVGNSLKLDCDRFGNLESTPYPRGLDDIATLVDDFTMLANSCAAEYTDELQWIGSNAVVQDMEIMRSKMNAEKLNIIGSSFGTRITTLYIERFPESSGRIILDAPLPPNAKIDALLLETVAAQQDSFERILNACGTTLPDCDRANIEATFVARVNILLDEGALNTFKAFFNLINIAIEESETGEILAPILIDYAISGDPTDMFALIEQFGLGEEGEDNDGTDSLTLERAVVCADDAVRPNVETLSGTLELLNKSSDLFAEAILPVAASCVGWPEALEPVDDIRTVVAPTSLVIGGIGDVRTPISWAAETAEAIGGVFVPSDHQGHTTIFVGENDCVDTLVADFLLEGSLPPEGTSCTGN